jgi:hypothetical protein
MMAMRGIKEVLSAQLSVVREKQSAISSQYSAVSLQHTALTLGFHQAVAPIKLPTTNYRQPTTDN